MDKKAKVLNLMRLHEILEKKTEIMDSAFQLLDGRAEFDFLGDAYDWIYDHFDHPKDLDISIPCYFEENKINELVELYKE